MNKHLLHHINQTLQAAPNLNKTIFVSSERNHSAQCWSSCVRLQNRDVHVYLAWNTTCSTKQIPMITTCFPRKQTVSSRTSRMQRSGTAAYWSCNCDSNDNQYWHYWIMSGHLMSAVNLTLESLSICNGRKSWKTVTCCRVPGKFGESRLREFNQEQKRWRWCQHPLPSCWFMRFPHDRSQRQ